MGTENYSELTNNIFENAQKHALLNYNQELTGVHLLAALTEQDGFFGFFT